MASISSLTSSGSSTSSIYGNRNIISGLASGMDTEALIENCIKGYQMKIAKLQQQQTKVTWKQDAYRSITDKLLSISQKYTSYTSKTNLSSRSFFLNSVNTTTNGVNASKVSATGRTNSEIKINAVKQLASAARYSVDAKVMETKESAVGTAVNFNERVQLTKLSGDLTLTVGGNRVSLTFDDDEIIKNANDLTSAINKKLSETELGSAKASTRVRAVNDGGTIRFETLGDSKTAGDAVWISGAYGKIKDTLGINAGALGKGDTTLKVSGKQIYEEMDRKQYLSNKTFDIKMGDETARVVLGDLTKLSNEDAAKTIQEAMQKQADAKFGKGKLKVEVNDKDGSFSFTPTGKDKDGKTPTVEISSSAGAALGLGTKGLSNSLSTSATLKQVFGDEFDSLCNEIRVSSANVSPVGSTGVDKNGNPVKYSDGKWYHLVSTGAADTNAKVDAANVRVNGGDTKGKDKDGKDVEKVGDKWYYLKEDGQADTAGESVDEKDVRPADNAVKGVDKNGREIIKHEGEWYYYGNTGAIDKNSEVKADEVRPSSDAKTGVDKDGNVVYRKENGGWYYKSDKADLVINGVNVGSFDKNDTIEDILNKINSSEAGVKASYSKLTNKFVLTADKTGSEGKIEISGALGEKLFGKTEVGKAEVNLTEKNIVADSEGNALAIKDKETGEEYYLLANTEPDGSVTYNRARKVIAADGTERFKSETVMGKPVKASMTDEAVLNTLKQARKGYEEGKDAIFNVTVNGDNVTLTRSSNVVDMDGMTVTLNDVFNNEKDANGVSFFNDDNTFNKGAKLERDSIVTFTTKADADKILEAVQAFITEFNEIATQVRTEYSTTPLKNSKKKAYEPLTDEDREGMSETQIKEYEEKAKTGLLFGDTDLSGLHNSLRNAITPSGDLRKAMSEIGLTVKYEGGITTLSLDENKFRAALDKDIDGVQKVFTASQENGDSYDGLMARTKRSIDTYASTSIGSYGILVRKAGTTSRALSLRDNTLQKQYNNLEDQIERWQSKMSDKVDYYTKQFTKLEQLMNQMNSQSSTLASLTGGY